MIRDILREVICPVMWAELVAVGSFITFILVVFA